jgi:hypothetical protein
MEECKMSKKDFAKKMLMKFFIIVTLINVAMFVLGLLYDKDKSFGYEAFIVPIIYGILSILPMLVTYSNRELSVRTMIFRKILQLILLELSVISFVMLNGIFEMEVILPLAISILTIAIIVYIISWILDNNEAQRLNLKLEEYQKSMKKM